MFLRHISRNGITGTRIGSPEGDVGDTNNLYRCVTMPALLFTFGCFWMWFYLFVFQNTQSIGCGLVHQIKQLLEMSASRSGVLITDSSLLPCQRVPDGSWKVAGDGPGMWFTVAPVGDLDRVPGFGPCLSQFQLLPGLGE